MNNGFSFFQISSAVLRNARYFVPFKKRFGYLGWVGYDNLGDELMYSAFQKQFKTFNAPFFKYTAKFKIFEDMFKCKFYSAVALGGGTLINTKGFYTKFKRAQEAGYVTFTWGTGVRNPEFWTEQNNVKNLIPEWIRLLKKCKYVSVRGPLSQKLLIRHGFFDSEVIGDSALYFAREIVRKKKRIRRIGINVGLSAEGMAWGNEQLFLEGIGKFIKVMHSKGWEIILMPVFKKDYHAIKMLSMTANNSFKVFYPTSSLEKTMLFLEGCDLFIGEKLHSVVLAMCAATPCIMLEYRPKCLDFMMSMNMERYNLRIDQISLDKLIFYTQELYENLDKLQIEISMRALHFKELQLQKALILSESFSA